MVLCLVVALVLGGWIEWTGRRARAIRGYRRSGTAEDELSIKIDWFTRYLRQGKLEGRPLITLAHVLNLTPATIRAAANRELSPEERRLLSEHELARFEVAEFSPGDPRTPLTARSLKVLMDPREMFEPGWLEQALRKEAERRRLRKWYEHAINRPWVVVPPDGGF